MRYIIMANGKGKRWGNHLGIPKHLISIDGVTLLQRTTSLVRKYDTDADVIITSSNPQCIANGAVRHSPALGSREIDRFCYELIDDDVCFLYGDTYYTEQTVRLITKSTVDEMLFFGTRESIVAVKVRRGDSMKRCIDALLSKISTGEIQDAKGWHLYHEFCEMPLEGKGISLHFTLLEDATTDFNRPAEYESFCQADWRLNDES